MARRRRLDKDDAAAVTSSARTGIAAVRRLPREISTENLSLPAAAAAADRRRRSHAPAVREVRGRRAGWAVYTDVINDVITSLYLNRVIAPGHIARPLRRTERLLSIRFRNSLLIVNTECTFYPRL